jgi:hypothetical protein
MNRHGILAFLLLGLALLTACKSRTKLVNIQTQWTSHNPVSIPFQTRKKELQLGNLVPNASFEQGRIIKLDSLTYSFSINSWKKIGEHVSWTNTARTDIYTNDDASHGLHAVRITRERADETDNQGEGILSDFIKVIPGHYQLSMDIRLEHVESATRRLGTRVFDAVNLRIYYYDKNKILIRSTHLQPSLNSLIDIGFKGMSFANFDMIDRFEWSSVFCRSGNFPFRDGYVPNDARYVKIFAGLKGTGTMWIDQVDFRFSNRNFTALEILDPLTDSTIVSRNALHPAPRETTEYHEYQLIAETEGKKELKPLILVPANADPIIRNAIDNMVSKLRKKGLYSKNENPVITRMNLSNGQNKQLVFCFGNNSFSSQFAGRLPAERITGLEQAYYIQSLEEPENIIFIGFSDVEAMERAINTIVQSVSPETNLYRHFNIIDYPDLTTRAVLVPIRNDVQSPSVSQLEYLISSGINCFIIEPRGDDISADQYLRYTTKTFNRLSDLRKEYPFIKTGFSFRDILLKNLNESAGRLEAGRPASLKEGVKKDALEMGKLLKELSKTNPDVIIHSDMIIWNAMHFGTPVQSLNHIPVDEFLNFVSIRSEYWESLPDQKNEVSPGRTLLLPLLPDNRLASQFGEGKYAYIGSLRAFSDRYQEILWTGPAESSVYVDMSDYRLMYGLLGLPMTFMDNTLVYNPEDYMLYSQQESNPNYFIASGIFNSFKAMISMETTGNLDKFCILNIKSLDEINLSGIATAADYLWNVKGYDSYISLWNALNIRYGKETAVRLIRFNDIFCRLVNLGNNTPTSGNPQRILKEGEALINEMDREWQKLTLRFAGDPDFLNSLSDKKNLAISRFYMYQKKSALTAPVKQDAAIIE